MEYRPLYFKLGFSFWLYVCWYPPRQGYSDTYLCLVLVFDVWWYNTYNFGNIEPVNKFKWVIHSRRWLVPVPVGKRIKLGSQTEGFFRRLVFVLSFGSLLQVSGYNTFIILWNLQLLSLQGPSTKFGVSNCNHNLQYKRCRWLNRKFYAQIEYMY